MICSKIPAVAGVETMELVMRVCSKKRKCCVENWSLISFISQSLFGARALPSLLTCRHMSMRDWMTQRMCLHLPSDGGKLQYPPSLEGCKGRWPDQHGGGSIGGERGTGISRVDPPVGHGVHHFFLWLRLGEGGGWPTALVKALVWFWITDETYLD